MLSFDELNNGNDRSRRQINIDTIFGDKLTISTLRAREKKISDHCGRKCVYIMFVEIALS